MRPIKIFSLSTVVLFAGCAPLRIREHQAIETKEPSVQAYKSRCDGFLTHLGSNKYLIKQQNLINGEVSLTPSQNELTFSLSFKGQNETSVRFNDDKLKYRYLNQEWQESPGKWTALFIPFAKGKSPSEFAVQETPLLTQQIFHFENDNNEGTRILIFKVSIPKAEKDIEIETPKVYLNTDLLQPHSLRFNWNDRWTIAPLNGC